MRKIIIRSLNTVGFTDIVEAADGVDGLAVSKAIVRPGDDGLEHA